MSGPARGKLWRRVHFALAGVWLALILPTLLWWRESILWVAAISIYANVASHWSAAQAAGAEQKAEENNGEG